MRKSRTIESQHGADLSRVGRNNNTREREKDREKGGEEREGLGNKGEGIIGWNVSKKERKE